MESRFELSDEDKLKIVKWMDDIKLKVLEVQHKISDDYPFNENYPYYGACGGGIEYIFIPTGLGTIFKVREWYTKEELDLTVYGDW